MNIERLKNGMGDVYEVEPNTGCWLWLMGVNNKGYANVCINGKSSKGHREMYVLSIASIPSGLCVCHSCDTPSCVNPRHLFVGTVRDNNRDCMLKGRHRYGNGGHGLGGVKGEKHWNAKLTNADVLEIQRLFTAGQLQKEIALSYGIAQPQVSRIVTGKERSVGR